MLVEHVRTLTPMGSKADRNRSLKLEFLEDTLSEDMLQMCRSQSTIERDVTWLGKLL